MTWYADDAGTTPVDLTGYTASLTVRGNDGTTLLTLTPTLGGTAGTIEATMSAASTSALTWTDGDYQLLLTGGGDTTALLHGDFEVRGL